MIKIFDVSELKDKAPVMCEVFRIGPWCGPCCRKIEYEDGRVEAWMKIDELPAFDPEKFIGVTVLCHGRRFLVRDWNKAEKMFEADSLNDWNDCPTLLTPTEVILGNCD